MGIDMSKFCIGIIDIQDKLQLSYLKEELQNVLSKYNLGVFCEFSYIEPFLEHYNNQYFCFSIADDQFFDNCEKLLLSDGSSINGYENNIPFKIRMGYIENALEKIMEKVSKAELFIGDSGTELSEFDLYTVSLSSFSDFATDKLNSIVAPDLHLIITD